MLILFLGEGTIYITYNISETQAVHLLPVLMRLESQDRPQHRWHGRGHGGDTPGQVRYRC